MTIRKIKHVSGFGVKNQGRSRFRGEPLNGTYQGHEWTIFSDGDGLFQWRLDKFSGYAGPSLADTLRALRRAVKLIAALQEAFPELPSKHLHTIAKLLRWERLAATGRLEIEGPMGKGEMNHYRVKELP